MSRSLNYFISGCVSISAFFFLLVGIPEELKICAIIAAVKTYKSIIKKKRKNHDKIVLLGKTKLDTIEVLIAKALIDADISYDEFISVSNVLREYNDMKKEIKNRQNAVEQIV